MLGRDRLTASVSANCESHAYLRSAHGLVGEVAQDRDNLFRQVAGECRANLRLRLGQKPAAEDKDHSNPDPGTKSP